MIKLNDSGIIVGQIKQLLHTFPLPQCQVGSAYPSADKHFLLRDHLKRWERIDDEGKFVKVVNCDNYVFGNEYLNITATLPIRNLLYDRETHRYLGKYLRFIRDYCGINLMSMYNCCDGDTNTNDVAIVCDIKTTGTNQEGSQSETGETTNTQGDEKKDIIPFTTGVDGCIVYKVPVSISSFTISCHSSATLEICAYIDNASERDKEKVNSVMKNTYIKRKATPLLYYSPFDMDSKSADADFIYKHQSELCLLIKTSSGLDTSVVVLEGTYLDKPEPSQKYFSYKPYIVPTEEDLYCSLLALFDASTKAARQDFEYQELVASDDSTTENKTDPVILVVSNADAEKPHYSDELLDSGFNVASELLSYTNATSKGLLSDKLLEYLTGNVITPISEPYEIKRVQKTLDNIRSTRSEIPNIKKYQAKYKDCLIPAFKSSNTRYSGIWHNEDHEDLKAIAYKSGLLNEYDTLGYLDKNLESELREVLDNVEV